MNITNLNDKQITLLEIFLNNYKQFRKAAAEKPVNKRQVKRQTQSINRFHAWLVSDVSAENKMFLIPFGLLDAIVETAKHYKPNPIISLPKIYQHD